MKWQDKNFGKSPFDQDYRDNYDAESDREAYERRVRRESEEGEKMTNYGPN